MFKFVYFQKYIEKRFKVFELNQLFKSAISKPFEKGFQITFIFKISVYKKKRERKGV